MDWCALHSHFLPLIRFYVEPFIYSLFIYVDLAIDFWYIFFFASTKESLTRIKEPQNRCTITNSHTAQIMTLTSLSVTFVRNRGRRRDLVAAKYLKYWAIGQVTVVAFFSLYLLLTDSTNPQSLWTLEHWTGIMTSSLLVLCFCQCLLSGKFLWSIFLKLRRSFS